MTNEEGGQGIPEAVTQLSPEVIRQITDFANKLAWKRPKLTVLRPELIDQYPSIAKTLEEHIKRSDARQRLILPDLRAFGNKSVAVFTDYGGESKDAKYYTYATLVCGWNLAQQFLDLMKAVREEHRLGDKEIEFKDFRMGQLQRALPGYLNALNMLPGFLLTLAVDKRLTSLFGPGDKAGRDALDKMLADAGLGERKSAVNEKLLRVAHIAAFLTGLLAHDGQKICWMTDHDAISPSPEMHQKTLELFARLLGIYARKGAKFPILGGALPFEQRGLGLPDMLSATDVVAGALDQYLSQVQRNVPDDIKVKPGCELVLQWLAHDGIGLKKMNVLMRPGAEKNSIEAATLEIQLKNPPKNPLFIPVAV